ncbi:sialic acid-binding Ig-like lectin 14 isoform X4 [Gopherus flavomarginatus]|uniref:sialic acid-binding Ig-like lectin 14 isoform X4 n=1 Tax=Gopherus flavomarginatus TaxID=286002 RepID=UPI0021CC34B3|nr:sialic acid-binding Ig-like lectin 14 isoform X4 [Gopherus flavomarginatus]
MGRALPPQQDTREWELPAQGPLWRPGGPAPTAAMLRVLILALLWRGSLSQLSGFTLTVPQSVSVQEGFCVFVPCTFTYSASYNTYNFWDYKPDTRLYGYWYKDPANESQDPPVASSDPSRGVSQETQGRFRLVGELVHGDCSLLISEAQWRDTGRYFFRFEKGTLRYSYLFNSDGTDAKVAISVPDPPGPPNITWTLTRNGRRDSSTLVANGSQLSARKGDSLRFLCSVASSPPAVLGWVRGSQIVEGASLEGENQLWLELPNVTVEDGGLYGCWAQNKQSSAQGTFQLLIEYSPQLGTRLNSSCRRQGPSISCSCSLRSQPLPQLQWQVDGEPLTGNSSRGALQVSSWAQGDEAVSTLNWTGSGVGGPRIFCLGSNPHGSYAVLHFDFRLPQRGAEEPGRLLGLGVACGLGVAVSFFLLGLCVIKLWGREPALPRAEPGEMANGSQAKLMADDASLIYSNVTTIPMGHKTPAACRTKGVQDEAAAAQAPLGPGEPDELHYATINFSKLQRKLGESPEAPDTEYSEVRLK